MNSQAAEESHEQRQRKRSVNETDSEELPGLDALTFDRELCTNPLCHCRRQPTKSPPGSNQPTAFARVLASPNSICSCHSFPTSPVTSNTQWKWSAGAKSCNAVDTVRAGPVFGAQHGTTCSLSTFAQLSGNQPRQTAAAADGTEAAPPFVGSYRDDVRCRDISLADLESVLPTDVASCHAHQSPAAACTCSQQAQRYELDMSVDELSGYFEDFCYIPKKMSAMAEMMYL